MTKITPDDAVGRTEDRLLSAMKSVEGIRHAIETLEKSAETGGDIEGAALIKLLNDLRRAINNCVETENKLDDLRNKQAGIARGGYALDLGEARAEIGRKLDKLRTCGGAESVSR